MTKRITLLDKTFQNIDEKIAALEGQIAALRLARQHLQAEQDEAHQQRERRRAKGPAVDAAS